MSPRLADILGQGPSINHVRGGLEIFSNPQRAILTIFNYVFCIFPMNLVALAQNFESRIRFFGQVTILNFDLIFFRIVTHVILRLQLYIEIMGHLLPNIDENKGN